MLDTNEDSEVENAVRIDYLPEEFRARFFKAHDRIVFGVRNQYLEMLSAAIRECRPQ